VVAEVDATHDSEARYPLNGCHPNTREEILHLILEWVREPDSPLYWLRGSAGTGKTTIAQTIAEKTSADGSLACSFFFSRNDPKRSVPTYLFLSIAFGLTSSIRPLGNVISEVIKSRPNVLKSSLETQLRELIVKQCRYIASSKGRESLPRLVVIDGIDECQGSKEQKRVLSIITSALTEAEGLPLRSLICSRPEPAIQEVLDSHIVGRLLKYAELEDSYLTRRDIEIYLLMSSQGFMRNVEIRPSNSPLPGHR
ncbi:hypothetical protein L218DRAFT_868321, partial [Marasmius fiardii PR-910]